MPKSYPPEFRCRVVELCRAGAQPSRVAADLGVSEATVYRWIAQTKWTPENAPGSAAVRTWSSPGRVRGSGSLKRSWS